MRKAIPALLLSAAGFVLVWQYEPSVSSEPVALPAPATIPSLPSSSTSAGAAPVETKTVNGSAERNSHGTVQVQVTFTGSQITDVKFLQLPNTGPSKMAGPGLVRKTLQAQNASVDTVSGATQTSESYIDSLRAAVDAKSA
jgi:uncharacterized protein with FMN-binding domain